MRSSRRLKPGWHAVWNWLQVIKDLCFYQVFWLRWLQFVLLYLIYQFIIVKDAPIIVLDEATAFSDPENEYLIQKAFEKLIQNKTVVMIAHRLSTIRNADQILVMEKGCLIESGTHDELLKKSGKYAQMWSSYTESINWKISTGKAV